MDRTYLEWNLVNWITVVLMVAVGMFLLSAATSGYRAYSGNSDNYSS